MYLLVDLFFLIGLFFLIDFLHEAAPSYIQIGANKFGIEKFLKIKLVQVLVKHPLECLDNTPMMTTKNKTKSLQIILFTTNPL